MIDPLNLFTATPMVPERQREERERERDSLCDMDIAGHILGQGDVTDEDDLESYIAVFRVS